MAPRTAAILAAAVLACGVGAARAQGQRAASQDIMPALLAEVRGLRAAMEVMASAGARVQLALGRVQLQEQRLNTAIRRLEEVRARLSDAQRGAAEHQDRIERMEASLKETPTDTREGRQQVAELEAILPELRRQSGRLAAEVQQRTADEAALANDVAAEQSRWIGFNQQLEELERSLGRH
jgi:chromosome segregation ATPase